MIGPKVSLIVLKKRGECLNVSSQVGFFLVLSLGKVWNMNDSDLSLAGMPLFR